MLLMKWASPLYKLTLKNTDNFKRRVLKYAKSKSQKKEYIHRHDGDE